MLALYFDLDGTLLNSSQCSIVTTQDTFRKFCNIELDPQKIIEKMGIPIEVTFRELSDGKIDDSNWDEIASYFREKYKINSGSYTSLYEGVPELLDEVHGQNACMFIVTSKKSAAAEHNLISLNARHYFQDIIGPDKVEYYKPHPDSVYKARQLLPRPALTEIVIGDADTDIAMGKAAGALTCAVTWGAHDKNRLKSANPDHIVDTIKDLRDLILKMA